jgi:hypothetical protein
MIFSRSVPAAEAAGFAAGRADLPRDLLAGLRAMTALLQRREPETPEIIPARKLSYEM